MRTQYLNGDDVTLQATDCDGCEPMRINGVMHHERGCPEAWRDKVRMCHECGCDFRPAECGQMFCDEACKEFCLA